MSEWTRVGFCIFGCLISQWAQAHKPLSASHGAAFHGPQHQANQEKTMAIPLVASGTTAVNLLKHALAHGDGILQLGGFWSKQGQSQQVNINGLIGDYFNVTNSQSGNFLLGLGYLKDGKDIKRAKMQYGLNWFYLSPTSVKGTVLQEASFTNLAYSYHLTHYPLYAIAKSTFQTRFPDKEITLDVGIGPNFMTTSQFKETSLGANTLQDAIFSGTTTTTFSATAGISLKCGHFVGPTQAELGYRFFYLGQGHFNPSNNQILNKLTTGAAFANALVFTLSI